MIIILLLLGILMVYTTQGRDFNFHIPNFSLLKHRHDSIINHRIEKRNVFLHQLDILNHNEYKFQSHHHHIQNHQLYILTSLLRGGDNKKINNNPKNENKNYYDDDEDGDDDKKLQSDNGASQKMKEHQQEQQQKEQQQGTKYFSLIHSVFQMNMDAKEDLINNVLDGDNDASSSKSYNSSTQQNSQIKSNGDTLDTTSVSTASSRLVSDDIDNELELSEDSGSDEDRRIDIDEYENEESDESIIINTRIGRDDDDSEEDEIEESSLSEAEQEEEEEKDESDEIDEPNDIIEDDSNEEVMSIHDIVQEEWDMIPDTEVEDETHETTYKERERIKTLEEQKKELQRQLERERLIALQDQEKQKQKLKRKRKRQEREKRRKEREIKRKLKSNDNDKMKERNDDYNNETETGIGSQVNSFDVDNTSETNIATKDVHIHPQQSYISSGWWETIDSFASLGFSGSNENLRLSKKLYKVRKKAAQLTGLHGILSGKGQVENAKYAVDQSELNEEELGKIRQRLAAIEMARKRVAATKTTQQLTKPVQRQVPRWRRLFGRRREVFNNISDTNDQIGTQAPSSETLEINPQDVSKQASMATTIPTIEERKASEKVRMEELRRIERVKEIDTLIKEGQRQILELQCQKDALQRRPNPMYKYSQSPNRTENQAITEDNSYSSARTFDFPSKDLVSEYIDELMNNGRLQKMNHTQLWSIESDSNYDDEEESIGDDLLTPSGDAKRLYENKNKKKSNNYNLGGGSWLLRQSLGMGGSLGEKIGAAVEDVAYKGVCSVMMSILARSLASLHGVNVMQHSDIRLFVESTSDLPPMSKAIYSSSSAEYTRKAIGQAIRKGSKKKRKKKQKPYHYGSQISDDAFIQRDAVVETLISHCQISAPLLKLFPADWQRALLGNIITLTAAVVSDFCDGVQFQILGHQLSFAFKPITEADMIQHIGVGGFRFNHRRAKPEEFEAAVRATSDDISKSLTFLDRWHQRALGGDLLKAQLGNLIARLVLTLVDEVLHSARMDLWSAQVGGPRIVAGLEYRVEEET